MKLSKKIIFPLLLPVLGCCSFFMLPAPGWESKFVKVSKTGALEYMPDAQGNTIPDFSRVGYYFGDRPLPRIAVVKTISATGTDNDQQHIQAAIDEIAGQTPDADGFRGALLLKKGTYYIPDRIRITTSGIVLRGEAGTRLVATAKTQVSLIDVSGSGQAREVPGSRVKITDGYVPTGATSFHVADASGFRPGDAVILFRPGTQQWITDLQMDRIVTRPGTKQWRPGEYDLRYERTITKIAGNKVTVDNPVVMPLETKYGGGELYKYTFEGRIRQVGVEDLLCESTFDADTAENHAWDAVAFGKAEHCWVTGVTARYFGYSCVNLKRDARNISVLNSNCFEHKSIITGSRRYSFNNSGQLNLFMNCHATDGRHDYVTGAITCGPNVFVHCTAKRTHADIGPHHRWASGTLYDNIVTDGEINVQDRGNWGSGHGWAGVTQVVWNCTVKRAAIQSPWASGKNYCIGLTGEKYNGRLKDRPDAEWEGQNKPGVTPASLYQAQLAARKGK
ncbi:hypothetical protein DLD77_02435 [Chitinophaga alhagiae]|uniref:Pectate lyase superfamily protein domain-containing protein n=1 Tax=Chitinophaga alhagiae TaxID=2203219 RepID=A0ABN5LMP5_9BACT|nr:hypothetical protein [Chitinophaga alhagiae]AWO00636.1 hypothetical protein DLD77_02435 [Chitinophaga alhagiae]